MRSENSFDNIVAVFFLCFMILTSCVEECREPLTEDVETKVEFVLDEMAGFTRSGFTASETEVEDVTLMAYSGGLLVASGSWNNGQDMVLDLYRDAVYDIYALANVGDFVPPVLESEVPGIRLNAGASDAFKKSFPMCWSLNDYVPSFDEPVDVHLVRLVSKIVLDVDCGDTGLMVTGVSLRQVPQDVYPFSSEGSRASAGMIAAGDVASDTDLAALASGSGVVFYMLENMQGTLLPTNDDPMCKVPSSVSEVSGLCSYIEVECGFIPGTGRDGNATYRIFLGEDETTNFDVQRNRVLSVSLKLTSDGLKVKGSWKITADYVQHVTEVMLDRSDAEIHIGGTLKLNASVSPSDAEDKSVYWTSDDPDVASVGQDGIVEGKGEGTCIIRVVSNDSPDCLAECEITVKDMLTGIVFDKSEVRAFLGSDGNEKISEFAVYAEYASGRKVDVTDACSYSSDSSSAAVLTPGVVTHRDRGTAVVEAVYKGCSAMLSVVTEAFAVAGVEFEQSEYRVSLGDSPVIRYRVLYNDGTASQYISYQLWSGVWASCNYVSVEDYEIASISTYGVVTARKVGKTAVTVSVYCYSSGNSFEKTVPLTVNEAYLVSVYATAPSMFYDNSEGPGLYGLYSDGSERNLTASAQWMTDNIYVTYSPNSGLKVLGTQSLTTGVTSVTFTATYDGMSASVASVYGKWVREATFRSTYVSPGVFNYKMVVIYADFTEEAVPFTYQTSTDGSSWTSPKNGTVAGVNVTSTMPATILRGQTVNRYYDYNCNSRIWTAGY